MMKLKATLVRLAIVLLLAKFLIVDSANLSVGFYRGKCGFIDVETLVATVITARFFQDPTIVAALLRLQFHDCFTNGCDASILIDGMRSEKTAPPNHSIRGYEIIDEAKAAVEKFCPALVSCADIIAMATRDAVFLSGGGRYNVETGRRDGLVSVAENVSLLSPRISVPEAIAAFSRKGLNATDMVLLLGAHSVGVTHCSLIKHRLYNFEGTGNHDPTMEIFLVNQLRLRCAPDITAADMTVNLDQNPFSPFLMDVSYYQNILLHRGILQIDQELGMHPLTFPIVRNLAFNSFDYPSRFGAAMVKLGGISVLTGRQGEIRRSCRATNS
ncbi:peroxidase 60-like [Euphorbia lathyris]|uniref:peroxidase 60-like n=1 Tax=Euphorbia lathyris TaxID=212925 RepID=UPI0033134BEE